MKIFWAVICIAILAWISFFGSWKDAIIGFVLYWVTRGILLVIDYVIESSERWQE